MKNYLVLDTVIDNGRATILSIPGIFSNRLKAEEFAATYANSELKFAKEKSQILFNNISIKSATEQKEIKIGTYTASIRVKSFSMSSRYIDVLEFETDAMIGVDMDEFYQGPAMEKTDDILETVNNLVNLLLPKCPQCGNTLNLNEVNNKICNNCSSREIK